ncbi:hypothetical protein F4809DRAFT_638138 [Biscogniauxia mediterranea]|nr:hypothetical protein F4809DRAFT_638138 [Biscogniauxia mediterranea]
MAPTGGRNLSATSNANSGANSAPAWQVAATNSTLNAWFGGRQPSWLANAKPVRPSPRPPAHSPRQPLQDTHPQPQPQPQPQAQPQPRPQSRRQSRPHTNPDPDPDPHATPPQSVASPSTSTAPGPAPRRPSASASASASASVSEPSSSYHPPLRPPVPIHPSNPIPDAVLPSPAPSDEPSPRLSNTNESPEATSSSVEHRSNPPATEADSTAAEGSDGPGEHQAQDLVSTANPPDTSRRDSEVSATPRASTPANMVLNTPPTPNAIDFNQPVAPRELPPRELPPNHPAKRRRIGNRSLEFLESQHALEKLRIHLHRLGGEATLEATVERPRYQLLHDACDEGDVFFIALHQLFCMWATNQAAVHRMCVEGVHDPSLVDNAFGIMGTILKSNSKLRTHILAWFTSFPAPLLSLVADPFYANAIVQVLNFLVSVSHRWMVVTHNHRLNGYPLLMSELLDLFRLYSPILQAILFRASRRILGIEDGLFGQQMEDLFRADQKEHRNLDGTFLQRPPSKEYQEYNTSLIRGYKGIIARSQSARSQTSQSPRPSSLSGPSVPPTTSPQQTFQTSNGYVNGHIQHNHVQVGRVPSTTLPPQATGNQYMYSNPGVNTSLVNLNAIYSQAPIPNQFMVPSQHILSSNSTMAQPMVYTPPYHSPNLGHQAQFGNASFQAPQISQHYFQPQPQQTQPQPQQQQQQHPGIARRTSQPSTPAPMPRPSPVQTTIPEPRVSFSGQHSPQMQAFAGQPVLSSNARRRSMPAPGPNSPNLTSTNVGHLPVNTQSPVQSPQNMGYVLPSSIRSQHGAARQQYHTVHPQDRLIPPPGLRISNQDYPHSPYDKRSIEISLHQVHLRSPRRLPRKLNASTLSERFYQAVKSFALPPTPIPPQPYLYNFKFHISESDYGRISFNETIRGECLSVNRFSNGSLRFRIRCVYKKQDTSPLLDNIWTTTETAWPEHIFMEINERNALEIKRKAHHSKDLPTEISSFVVSGENAIAVTVLDGQITPPSGKLPYLMVEIIEVLSHSTILDMVRTHGTQPPDVTRDIIKRRLSRSSCDDDDVAMAIDGVSIDLADPFTAVIFKTPVRGKACTHLECFDLENWLNTRLGKKKACLCGNGSNCTRCPNEPSFVDKWKCPFCDGDARPYSLRVDGFLVQVREQLEKEGTLHVKSIIVSPDGSWKPKMRPGDDDSGTDSDEDNTPAIKTTPKSSTVPFQHREVIEIDDD